MSEFLINHGEKGCIFLNNIYSISLSNVDCD